MSDVARMAPSALDSKVTYAKHLAQAGLLPKAYQGQPANLLLAMEYADALDIPTMTAVSSIHVIEGKPTASAGLMSALVRRAGHKLRVTGDDTQAVAEIVRADDPEFTFRSVWTMERAKAAGLAGKGVWKSYPAAMLKARAISEVARDACQEALSGVIYTPEELGATVTVTADGEMAPADLMPEPAPEPADIVDAEVVEEDTSTDRDWAREIATATDVATLRTLWAEAKADDVLDLYGQDITDKVAALKSATPIPPPFTPEPAVDVDVEARAAEARAALKEATT
jgi:hypothetical protein